MDAINVTHADQFVSELLAEYLGNGMGAMSKRGIDILVMNLLEKYSDLADRSNHDLSILLQSTESRIKGLRYEARLKYPPDDDKFIEKAFLAVLARSQFDTDKKVIIFVVEDSYLRYAIQGRLKAKGMFADNSFNSELVKINIDSLEAVIREMYGDTVADQYKEIFEELVKQEDAAAQRLSFRNLKHSFLESAVSSLGSAATAGLLAYLKSLII